MHKINSQLTNLDDFFLSIKNKIQYLHLDNIYHNTLIYMFKLVNLLL